MTRSRRAARIGAVVGATCLAVLPSLQAVAQPAPPSPVQAPPETARTVATTGSIAWKRCIGIQCAEFDVPLDHADPSKGTTTLVLARRPADDQAHKKGVLFINPGGPGGSAVFTVSTFAQILGRDIRTSFDIVGVEPRGVGGSDAITCEGRPGEEIPTPAQIFPWKDDQYASFLERDRALKDLCLRSVPRILPHMTTADVARDMDLVRAALGQQKINYYGVSYGSYLGATYANLFPNRVRSMVVDGVIDPIAWSTGRGRESETTPATTRLRSGVGAHEALMSAIAECENVGERYCAEHDQIRDDWAALTTRLRNESVNLGEDGDEMMIGYDVIVALALGSLYDPEGVPDLLAFIHEFREVVDTPADARLNRPTPRLRAAYQRVVERDQENRRTRIAYDPPTPEEEPWAPVWEPTFEGVLCTETDNPKDPRAWITAGKLDDRRAPGFGPLWTWSSSVCAGVPSSSGRYTGPFTKRPAGGMLVMTTKHDPATPYSGARVLRSLTPGSKMVTVDGWGHATLDMSGCASKARNTYLSTGRLPATDQVCRPDHELFTALD